MANQINAKTTKKGLIEFIKESVKTVKEENLLSRITYTLKGVEKNEADVPKSDLYELAKEILSVIAPAPQTVAVENSPKPKLAGKKKVAEPVAETADEADEEETDAETEEVAPAPEPTPAPAEEPAPAPAPVEEPAPAAEPAPEPELPALNAEAEALLPRAEGGDAVAQFNLARLYALGEGMQVNRAEFVRWCRTAADQGLPEAQYTMGCCYLRGLGVETSPDEGRRLLEAAAASGYAPAAEELKR